MAAVQYTFTHKQYIGREVIQQQIGTWPVRKEDLVSKYQKEFSAFVNAIDFDDTKQTG